MWTLSNWSGAILIALAATNSELCAQRRITFSPGFAVGTALSDGPGLPTSSQEIKSRHALLTLDVSVRRVPVRLRAEAMAGTGLQYAHGPFSLGASVVLPIGERELRPYVLAGAGVYGVGGVGHPTGATAGGGAEYRAGRSTYFLEGRLHSQSRHAISLGVRF